jgi:hypothetical protein
VAADTACNPLAAHAASASTTRPPPQRAPHCQIVDFVPHPHASHAATPPAAVLRRDAVDPAAYARACGAWTLVEWGITDHLALHPHLAHGHGAGGPPQPKVRMGAALDDVDSGTAVAPGPASAAAGSGGGGRRVDGSDSDDEVEVVSGGGGGT